MILYEIEKKNQRNDAQHVVEPNPIALMGLTFKLDHSITRIT